MKNPPAEGGLVAKKPPRRNADPLVGNCFHSYSADEVIKWQGVVVARINDDHYLVQLFDWLVGGPSCARVASLDDMRSWKFYETDEDMRDAYNNAPRKAVP